MPVLQGGGGDHLCPVLAHHLVRPRAVGVQTHPETVRLLPVVSPSDAHLPRCHGENGRMPAARGNEGPVAQSQASSSSHTPVLGALTRPSAPQIVLHREKEVKQTECDMATVHHLLSRIPQDLPYELLICQARDLFDQYPPSLLAKRAALQSHKR